MKARYIVALAIIILATILFEYLMLAHPMGDCPKLGNAIQAAAVFVAPSQPLRQLPPLILNLSKSISDRGVHFNR
jgi:hypothetical protein